MKFSSFSKEIKKGELSIPSGKIDITDPCYDKDVWCRINDKEIVPGEYDCNIIMLDGEEVEEYGERVAAMVIRHKDADPATAHDFVNLHLLGEVSVDAGLMSISEAGTKQDYNDEEWDKIGSMLFRLERETGEMAFVTKDFTLNKEEDARKAQFWSSSGLGDGSYDVLGFNSHDPKDNLATPDVLVIEFMSPENIDFYEGVLAALSE